ncbi:MAG: hypothetical protein ABH867_00535 [Patescibacteria group bacterium]|nr:hypothetical protein [Patescibacteria group bacterium]
MKLKEILLGVRNLDLYTPEEWQEYISYFSSSNEILSYIAEQSANPQVPRDLSKSLLLRIKGGKGATSIPIDIGTSDKITDSNYLANPEVRARITLGIVSGCYDLLHLRHIRSVIYAKQFLRQYEHPRLCVLILSDENIGTKKGNSRPILNINERLEMICGINCVDYVIPLREPNCLTVLEKVKPDYFFKARKDNAQAIVKQEIDLVESCGGRVVIFPPASGRSFSTTKIIETVLKGG